MTFNKERPFAPAELAEIPANMVSACFDCVASVARTVTISFPSRSPMVI